ncbi:MAG: MoaD/ThiS family protein [Pseudomonadota bacterium]|nr:MoaD/ThiS family protein [Pseudomonadota bacterium]
MQIYFHGFGATRILSGYMLEIDPLTSIAGIRKKLMQSIEAQEKYASVYDILSTTVFATEQQVFSDEQLIVSDTTLHLLPPVCGG